MTSSERMEVVVMYCVVRARTSSAMVRATSQFLDTKPRRSGVLVEDWLRHWSWARIIWRKKRFSVVRGLGWCSWVSAM